MSFFRRLFGGDQPGAAAATADAQPAAALASADGDAPPAAPDPNAPADGDAPPADGDAAPAAPDAAPAAPTEGGAEWWEEVAPAPAARADDRPAPAPTATDAAPPSTDAPDEEAQEDDGTRPLHMADIPALTTLRSRQGLAIAALRDIGRVRSVNQDSIFALTTTLPREGYDVTIGLFIVADGMGGHDGGEIASRMAIGTIARYVLSELVIPALSDGVAEALQPLIIAAVQEANRAIWEHAQAIGSDMGTTCTVALLLGQALYIGHVGDSRAYLSTPTGLRLITTDHSTVGRLIQLGQLDPSEAREHPLRSQLYRTVGQHPEVLVDFIYQPIGDATHLLLCSDGLWSMLDEEVLLDVIEHSLWPHDTCRELVARANLAGGDDNISAVVVALPTQP